MEEDKVNPNSQPPSPLPTWLEGQDLSGQWVGAGCGSDPPLSETEEEEGPLVDMDHEWEYEVAQELSQRGVVGGQELCLWVEVVREFYRWQEEVTVQEFCPWGSERHQELCHWEASATAHELDQWDEDDETYQELSQWEADEKGQELSQWQGKGYQQASPSEEDVRGHLHVYQGEEDKREPELSRVADNSDEELSQGKHYNIQELPQVQKAMSNQKWSQREEGGSSQGLVQWGEGASQEMGGKGLHPERNQDAQICAQERPGSPSSVGTQAAGEAASEVPSASPASGSPLDTESEAAAPAKGVQEEEPSGPVAPDVEKAPSSPFLSEEVASSETDSSVCAPHSLPDVSQAVPDIAQDMICEMRSQALLEVQASGQQPEDCRDMEQSLAAEVGAAAPRDREESLNCAPLSPCCSPSPSPCPLATQGPIDQQVEAERGVVLAEQDREEGALAGQLELSQMREEEVTELSQGGASCYQDMSQGEACPEQELSPVEDCSSQELSEWDKCSAQELSQGEGRSCHDFSDLEESIEQGLSSHGEVGSYQDVSDWEEFIGQELPKGKDNRPSVQSSWGDDSDKEREQDNWQSVSGRSIGVKPLL